VLEPTRRYQGHEIACHLIQSVHVAETYKIQVFLPRGSTERGCRYPVLYAPDADELFPGLATLTHELQAAQEVTPFILVGIGYESDRIADSLRMRDLLPHAVRAHFGDVIKSLVSAAQSAGSLNSAAITSTTDAEDFLSFLREELIPLIDSQYPTKSDSNAYFGYSAGGTFGLHTLIAQPQTFKHYILASPATSYAGHHFGREMVGAVSAREAASGRCVFISVGELEEFLGEFDLTSGYYLLLKHLRDHPIPGVEIHSRVFPGETHATAWAPAFGHGTRMFFGPKASLAPNV
jgi:predicted alpha/beta superfamily hydrolase